MEEKKLVPKLRFPGFTEPWEQRKFKNFVQIRRGLTYKPSDIASSGIRVLRSSNINEDQFITGTNDVFVNIDAVDIPYVKNGDILLTSANGSAHLVGKHAIINDIVENSAVHGGFMLLVESKNPQFINALLGSNWYKKFINLYVSGGNGAIGNLSKSDLEEQDVMFPSEEEQKAIGRVYFYMNHLITLHQRKLEHLKLKKKSLLQKLFPKEGEVYPELRFPGFTDPWEQRKFKSLFQKNLERNDGQFPFNKTISISRMIYSESGNGANTESLDNYKVLRVGDIAFEGHENKDFKFGRFVMNDVGNGIMSPRFTVLRPLIDMELNFWKEYINYEPIMQKKLVYSTKKGTMMNELVIEDFLNQYVAVPSIQEQQKIGYLLKCMTDDITLHQRKLEHLQLLKKALLQQLFV